MSIYIGVGGWVFDEWRGDFYPKGLSQKRELEYASRHLTAIEVNGTYYGSQKPESFGMLAQTPQTRRNRLNEGGCGGGRANTNNNRN